MILPASIVFRTESCYLAHPYIAESHRASRLDAKAVNVILMGAPPLLCTLSHGTTMTEGVQEERARPGAARSLALKTHACLTRVSAFRSVSSHGLQQQIGHRSLQRAHLSDRLVSV